VETSTIKVHRINPVMILTFRSVCCVAMCCYDQAFLCSHGATWDRASWVVLHGLTPTSASHRIARGVIHHSVQISLPKLDNIFNNFCQWETGPYLEPQSPRLGFFILRFVFDVLSAFSAAESGSCAVQTTTCDSLISGGTHMWAHRLRISTKSTYCTVVSPAKKRQTYYKCTYAACVN